MVVLFMRYIKGNNRNQVTFLPDTLDEYVSENNPVRVIDAFVNNIDLVKAGFNNAVPAKEGRPGYNPRHLIKLYVYGYFNKIRSSRKLMTECTRNVEVMWLIDKLVPDFRTISDFRKNNPKALKNVFRAFVKVCVELDLYKKELIAIDGSKFRAVNSKDKNFTRSKLKNKLKRIEKNIEEYLEELDEHDEEESEDSEELTKEEIKEKIKDLEKRQEKYNKYLKEMKENNETQKSLTDPESRLMRTHNGGFDVCFNVQTAVDAENHMIADFEVTNKGNDMGLLNGLAKNVKNELECDILELAADKGYESIEDMLECLKNGIIPNVSLKDGATKVNIPLEYEKMKIDSKTLESTDSKDIEKCLRAGVLPKAYRDKNLEIKVVEKAINKKSDKYFKLNEDRNSVTCPEGKILNKSAYLKKRKLTRFANRSGCRKCTNKCTKSKYKQVDLKDGQEILYAKIRSVIKEVVITIKPDKEKIMERKCIVEHPFGTIKYWSGGSYLLLKGKIKATADLSLSFLAYNMKRAINIVGVEKLMKHLTEEMI